MHLLDEHEVDGDFSNRYTFPFDDFQIQSIRHIACDESVMVAAPTSAGKTVVAEYALWRALRLGKRAVYTSPIKALSNQKRRELERLFPGQVGLLTGDRSDNRDAPIVVMTTEVLRNMLLEDPGTLVDVQSVVFDEVHYLADRDRGTIWEESIITCLPEIQLVCLSATIANAEEIAAWISDVHRPIALIRHDERPVPLDHFTFWGDKLRLIRSASDLKRLPPAHERPARSKRRREREWTPEAVVSALRRDHLMPAIWFAFTRQGVEDDAEQCALACPELSGREREIVDRAIEGMLSGLPAEDRSLDQIARLLELLRRGVGFHHAGLIPPCKDLVENLFTEGLLSVVCATDTLSVGINMPARTVVISNMSRPVAGMLTPNDFSQLTGRAGRRGIDKRGAVVILPSPFYDFGTAYTQVTGPLEPVLSRFTLRYSTLLSLFGGGRGENRVTRLVGSSLHQFQLFARAREAEAKLATVEAEMLCLPPIPQLDGREEELDEYLGIQRRLTAEEKSQEWRRHAARGRHSGRKTPRLGPSPQALALRALLKSHPMHRLASRPDFQQAAARRLELLRRRNRLLRTVETARQERDREGQQTARAVTTVLRRLGYIQGGKLSPKAAGLREMVVAAGIVISEMYHERMFDELSSSELAEVFTWFASDQDRRRYNSFVLPAHLRTLRSQASMVFARVSRLEEQQGIRLAQGPSTWFYGVALAWCAGDSITAISPNIEMGEGDIISTLNKTVDLLDQFRALLSEYSDYGLLGTTTQARALLNRGMVAMLRSEGVAVLDPVPVAPDLLGR